jgi:hypothetical protein
VLAALGTTDEMLSQNAGFCSVCAGDPDDVVGIPCGSMAAAAAARAIAHGPCVAECALHCCEKCIPRLASCPMCRRPLDGWRRRDANAL